MDRLDWLERAGIENLKEHSQNSDFIRSEATRMLTILFSGAGAALYFGAKETELVIPALGVSAWLFAIAFLVTLKCLMFGRYPSVWNAPRNLNDDDYEFDELRKAEIANFQMRIDITAGLNRKKGKVKLVHYCCLWHSDNRFNSKPYLGFWSFCSGWSMGDRSLFFVTI